MCTTFHWVGDSTQRLEVGDILVKALLATGKEHPCGKRKVIGSLQLVVVFVHTSCELTKGGTLDVFGDNERFHSLPLIVHRLTKIMTTLKTYTIHMQKPWRGIARPSASYLNPHKSYITHKYFHGVCQAVIHSPSGIGGNQVHFDFTKKKQMLGSFKPFTYRVG